MVDPAEGSGHREQLTAAYTLVAADDVYRAAPDLWRVIAPWAP
jgi:hypothetical protein